MREIERLPFPAARGVLAQNGSEGLRALEKNRPCIILLDLLMPVMDGLMFPGYRPA